MAEHRLIEEMLSVVRGRVAEMEQRGEADPVFIDTVVDFIRMYADRTHHGKEEDILFRELAGKNMDGKNARLMRELLDEHLFGRQITGELVAAKERYQAGDTAALGEIVEKLKTLAAFYPRHIEKEDNVFFPETESLFTPEELDSMLAEFREFDRKMIHEKYTRLVAGLGGKSRPVL
jgi:hemerythrin-like domain-containing protein